MICDALRLIGLAQRAGKCVSGVELCQNAIREGRAALILLDMDTKESTANKIEKLGRSKGTLIYRIPKLGHAIGKEERMTCVVVDPGFAMAIEKKILANIPGGVVKE